MKAPATMRSPAVADMILGELESRALRAAGLL